MASTTILRTRIDPRRKARVERILEKLGMTPTQAVNILFAQIEQRKGLPFLITLGDSGDLKVPTEHIAKLWSALDGEDFSHLDKR